MKTLRPRLVLGILTILLSMPLSAQQGSLDPSFSGVGKVIVPLDWGGDDGDLAKDVAIQLDGKIVAVGEGAFGTTDSDFAVVRLESDGSLDTSFGSGGKARIAFDLGGDFFDSAEAVALQADGKIVVAGVADAGGDQDVDFAIARLDASGRLDSTFGTAGKVRVAFDLVVGGIDQASGVLVQPDGKIVVTGTVQSASGHQDFAAVRLHPSGSLDTGFGNSGKVVVPFDLGDVPIDTCYASALQSDGKIVLAGVVSIGNNTDFDFGVVRLRPDGSLDPSFDGDGKKTVFFDSFPGGPDRAKGVAIDPNQRILLVGYTLVSSHGTKMAMARLTPSGALDTTFAQNGKLVTGLLDQAVDVVPVAHGKILVGGRYFHSHPANILNSDFGALRLLGDGSLDTSFGNQGVQLIAFDLGQNDSDVLAALDVQFDGNIVLAGWVARAPRSDYDFGLVRLVGEPFFTFP